MSSAPLLILAGGRSQVPLVQRAAELGHSPWVFDRDPAAPAAMHAERFDAVSARDPEGVLARVRERADVPPAGVVSASAHPDAQFAAAVVARALEIPGPDPDAVRRVQDKGAQLSVFSTSKFPHARCALTFGPEEAADAVRRAGPSVLRPGANTSGSAGVWFTAPDDPELDLRARSAAAAGDGRILVADQVEGDEYSINVLATPAGIGLLAFARKEMRGNPPLPAGHVLEPAGTADAEELRRRAVTLELAAELAAAFALEHTAFNADVLWTPDGPVLLEVGLLFDAKVDRLLDAAGVDVYGALAALAMGEPLPEIGEPRRASASRFLYAEELLTLDDVTLRAAERAAKDAGVRIEWQLAPGDAARPPRALADTVGWLVASARSAVSAAAKLAEAEQSVTTALSRGEYSTEA